jgi:hypothetical protein
MTKLIYVHAGPYLGILRPWAQENFAPPPHLFVHIQLCVSKKNTKNCGTNIVFSIDLPEISLSWTAFFFCILHFNLNFFNMPPLEICRPGPGPLWPVRKYGPACMYSHFESNL